MQEKMNNQQTGHQQHQQKPQKPEGTISVDYVPPTKTPKAPTLKRNNFIFKKGKYLRMV